MSHSTRQPSVAKPKKPRPDFPLFPHASGRWAKKVRGKFAYFGKVADDPDGTAALEKWLDRRDDLYAGRTPQADTGALTVRDLIIRFLRVKRSRVDTGELNPRTFKSYHETCRFIADTFGKNRSVENLRPEDFGKLRNALSAALGPTTLRATMQRVRTIFKYAADAELIPRAVKFGPEFQSPTKRVIQKARRANGPKMFEADEIQALLTAAKPHMKSMILLGINCGFGNSDVATLTLDALDLDNGWVDHPRPKTEVDRKCPLWPETVEALRATIAARPKPTHPQDKRLVFITRQGNPWVRMTLKPGSENWEEATPIDSVGCCFQCLLKRLKMKETGNRKGVNFYAIRHTFETIGGESRDQVAVDALMGHVDPSMAAVYRERISDERLKAVTEHVRHWLFASADAGKGGER